MSKIGIIGGGPAGLALAHDLSQDGHHITIFEAAPELGGLARSFQFGDIRIERYYHFICADDVGYMRKLKELGIENKLRWKPTRMGFFYNGKLYPFSSAFDLLRFNGVSLLGRLRYGLSVLYCSFINNWENLDEVPAEAWLIRWLGRNTYMATWYPLLKVKFNRHHNQISAAWVWHRIHRVAKSRKTPLHRELLGHLEGGTDSLINALESELKRDNVRLLLGKHARKILIDHDKVLGLQTADGNQYFFDYVVSAVPLPIFRKLVPDLPVDYSKQLNAIDFIGVICITLRLRQSLTEYFWLNINDTRVPFNGCIEYTNLNPEMTQDDSKIIYVPYYLPRDHERFSYSDEQLLQECIEALAVVNPSFSASWIIDYAVSRDPFAQVICRSGFAQQVPTHQTPVQNLYLIESSQLYPSDRTISGTIDLAHTVAKMIKMSQQTNQAI